MKHKTLILFFIIISWLILSPLFYFPAKASPPYEDFSTYTEVDTANDRIQKNSTWIDHASTRNEDTYLYKNYSLGFFTNFTCILDVRTDFQVSGYIGYFWMLSNNLDDFYGHRVNNYTAISLRIQRRNSPPKTFIRLQEVYNQTYNNDDSTTLTANTWYFIKIVKNGTAFNVGIYTTDNKRDNGDGTDGDVDNLAITLSKDHSFSIIYGCNTYNDNAGVYLGNTDIRFLEFTIMHDVIFYFNIGGMLRVDNFTISNGTLDRIQNGSILELASLPQNSSFVFSYFEWDSSNSTTNPYNLTITSDLTVWCYFSVPSVEGVYMGYGLVFLGLIVGLIIGVLLGSKK